MIKINTDEIKSLEFNSNPVSGVVINEEKVYGNKTKYIVKIPSVATANVNSKELSCITSGYEPSAQVGERSVENTYTENMSTYYEYPTYFGETVKFELRPVSGNGYFYWDIAFEGNTNIPFVNNIVNEIGYNMNLIGGISLSGSNNGSTEEIRISYSDWSYESTTVLEVVDIIGTKFIDGHEYRGRTFDKYNPLIITGSGSYGGTNYNVYLKFKFRSDPNIICIISTTINVGEGR